MRNLNPLYEFSITDPSSIGGIAGGTTGFITSKLIDKYFINASLDKLNKIRDIVLTDDSIESTLQKIQQIDPNIFKVFKQFESNPDWKHQAINILNNKIRKKKLIKIGARTVGTAGGAVLGGMIGNYFGSSNPEAESKPTETPQQQSELASTTPPSKHFTSEELEKSLTLQQQSKLAPVPPPSRSFTAASELFQ